MQRQAQVFKLIKAAWLLACFGIGLNYFGRGSLAGESLVGFMGLMTLVSFPSGYLAIYLTRALVWLFPDAVGDEMTRTYYFALSLWVLMTSLGYFQWFGLLPWLLERFKVLKTDVDE